MIIEGNTNGPRIGIIGAGAAGLAAGHALRKAGHTSVTVLERADRVGGKCHTFYHEGRSYELGAAALTFSYFRVRRLLTEMGLGVGPTPTVVFLDADTRAKSYFVPSPRSRRWVDLGVGCVKFARELVRHRNAWKPGFGQAPAELMVPFTQWAKCKGLTEVSELLRPWFTGFGYGSFDDIPAAYILKYITICNFPLFEIFDGGYQALWERVASRLDVRCNTNIRRVIRSDSGVKVETDGECLEFDRIIVACPLDAAAEFLDTSADERTLISKIQYVDYRVVAASVEGLSSDRYTFCPKHLLPEGEGEVMFLNRRWKDSDVVLFYSIGEPPRRLGGTVSAASNIVARLGGRITRVHRERRWRYFPHVASADMRSGFYPKLESLQGARKTYYVGEVVNFPCVETVVSYSEDLVSKHFAPVRQAS